jgi:alpha-glucosidase
VAADGWACWAYSNHDVERHASRWGLDDARLRLYLAILLSLRGSVCLYQGEELGLHEAYVAFEDLQDPYGKRFWPKFRGRDGCRTPMVWSNDNTHAGFSEAKPWLPVAFEQLPYCADVQGADETSLLNFYRRMLAWRKTQPALVKGGMTLHDHSDTMIAWVRDHAEGDVFCAFNLAAEPAVVTLPDGNWERIEAGGFEGAIADGSATLPAHHALFARRK